MKEQGKEDKENSPKPNTSKSPLCNKKTVRELSKRMRVANYIYQVIMIIIGGTMILLTQLDRNGIKINEVVLKVFSVLSSAFPVVWTNLLNLFKKSVCEENEPK